jgi:hypothetical protein
MGSLNENGLPSCKTRISLEFDVIAIKLPLLLLVVTASP